MDYNYNYILGKTTITITITFPLHHLNKSGGYIPRNYGKAWLRA